MVELADIVEGCITAMAGNTYINSELGTNVFFDRVPQQISGAETSTPYCSISQVADSEKGFFGSVFADAVVLQFTVWTIDFTLTSQIISAIGLLFNNYNLTLSDNCLVGMKRNSSIRNPRVSGQDKNTNFIYQASVDFRVLTQGN